MKTLSKDSLNQTEKNQILFNISSTLIKLFLRASHLNFGNSFEDDPEVQQQDIMTMKTEAL